MAINVTHLRSFFHVASARSFTKAARNACVSQPTLTRQIMTLEKSYGIPLLDRTTSRVDLTQEGHQLFDLCQEVFGGLDEIENFLKSQHTRSIRVDAVLCEVVSEILMLAHHAFPKMRFDLRTLPSTEVMDSLLERTADFGLLTLPTSPPPELEHFLAYRGRLIALVNTSHPWSRRGKISFKELQGQKIILATQAGESRRLVDKNLELLGVDVQIVQVVDSSELMIDLVERGVGIGVTGGTGLVVERLGVGLSFEEETTSIDVHFACRTERLMTQPFRTFFGVIKANIDPSKRPDMPKSA